MIDLHDAGGAVTVLQTPSSNPNNASEQTCRASLGVSQEVLKSLSAETLSRIETLEHYELPIGLIERLKQRPSFSSMEDKEFNAWLTEFKKFVAILILNDGQNRRIEMVSEIVDEVWHTFILFTKEYADFCNKVMGKFIHHEPNVDALFQKYVANPVGPIKNTQEIGIQNFNEDYKKYFGRRPSDHAWDKKLDTLVADSVVESIEQKKNRMISILSVGILLTVDALIALVLVRSYFLENTKVLDYIIPTALGVLAVAILFYVLARKHEVIKEILVVGYFFVLVTVLALGLAFIVLCNMTNAEKVDFGFPTGFSLFIATVITLLFISNKVKRGSIYSLSPPKKRSGGAGCGSGAVAACSGGGGGCGGGGC